MLRTIKLIEPFNHRIALRHKYQRTFLQRSFVLDKL